MSSCPSVARLRAAVLLASAFVAHGASDFHPEADAVVVVRTPVFQKALAAEVRRGRIPKELGGLTGRLTAEGVAFDGFYAGSYLQPSFAVLVQLKVPATNRAVIRLASVRVSGVELRRLASILVGFLMERLAGERRKGHVVVRDAGRAADGAHEIEVVIRPADEAPHLTGIEFEQDEARIYFKADEDD